MDNNQNDDGLGKYKKDFEEIQDYCMILKKIEENTELIYKNLNDNNTQTKTEMAYLINIKDYNKFKEQIEYNTFINNINGYKEAMAIKFAIQESENKNELKNKFKQAIVNSIQDLYKLLKENHEYIIINAELIQNLIDKKDEGIYSYYINSNELILNIKGEILQFFHNKNIINLKSLKTDEIMLKNNNNNNANSENIISSIDNNINNNEIKNNETKSEDLHKLTDWLINFILCENNFKKELKVDNKKKEKGNENENLIEKEINIEKKIGYLIEYTTYENWEKNLQLKSLRSIILQFLSKEKDQISHEEKQQIINVLEKYNISTKNHIQSLKFDSIEKLKIFNKVNNLILLSKELFLLINDDEEKNSNEKENEIEYISSEKTIDIFIKNEKSTFLKFDNVIYSYLYNNLYLLTKINIFHKNFNEEKKPSMYYILSKELLRKYKECFLYKNLIPFIKGTNFNKLISDSDIFDFIKTIPNNLINSIQENIKSFKLEINLISPKAFTTNNNTNFAYINDLDRIFLNGNLFINFCNIHSYSGERNKILRNIAKFCFVKEKLLILFMHKNEVFGQIGNINNSNDDDNMIDIDYLISVKKNNTKNKGIILLNDILKGEEDYNKFYQNIYDSNQEICFEYKISDELILNILNFKRREEQNQLSDNPFFINNNNQLQSVSNENNNINSNDIQNINNNNNQFVDININTQKENKNYMPNPFSSHEQQQNNAYNLNMNLNHNNINEGTKIVLNKIENLNINNNSTIIEDNQGNKMKCIPNSDNKFNDNTTNNNQNNNNNINIINNKIIIISK